MFRRYQVEWGDGEYKDQSEWLELRDIVNGGAGLHSTACWLGIQAKAKEASDEAVREVCGRSCGVVRLGGGARFHCRACHFQPE